MKYSLRSLMIAVLVAPAAIGVVSWLFFPAGDPAWWTWSKEKASLDYCIKKYLPDYQVELVVEDAFPNNTRVTLETITGEVRNDRHCHPDF